MPASWQGYPLRHGFNLWAPEKNYMKNKAETGSVMHDEPGMAPIAPELKRETWGLVAAVLEHSRAVLLHGRPGTGKTYAAQTLGLRQTQAVFTITMTPETPAAEIRGHYIPKDGAFYWQDGPAIRAWREGGRLIINEIDLAGGDVTGLLYAIAESKHSAALTLPTGELVKPAEEFQVVATTNAPIEELPEAILNRFPVALEIKEANPVAIAQLPEDLRNAAAGSVMAENNRRISLRCWLEYAQLRGKIGHTSAAAAIFGERAADVLAGLKLAGGQ
jgi:MoxR-like ATPase